MKQKRLIISALSGGSGKTLCSLGLCRHFLNESNTILPFKKGPDYIDTTWLSLAAKYKSYNLDPFFLDKKELLAHFMQVCKQVPDSIALIEGNRGLYDGKDILGSASTAELAVHINTPVILTIDTKKATRTLAALVKGMVEFDKRVNILGLIFNNTASRRHEKIIEDCIHHYCETPILGFIPRFKENPLPERHLGLVLNPHHSPECEAILNNLADVVQENVNTQQIVDLLQDLPEIVANKAITTKESQEIIELKEIKHDKKVRIAYIKDKALWFYYTENLEALEKQGAELVQISLFDSTNWDSIDALYIGGGYPELYAQEIEQSPLLEKIKECAEDDMPIYAECGGFMILARSLHASKKEERKNEEHSYKMTNIFPIDLEFYKKPQGLGYIEAYVQSKNSYFSQGSTIKGHEFHYSIATKEPQESIFSLQLGTGMGNKQDAVQYKNVFACYTHIYALNTPEWAVNLTCLAQKYKEKKAKRSI